MKQLGRSVGRAGDYNHLFSLAPSVPSPPRVHTAALRYSKATATVVALPLTSDPLCLTALARVKLCALVYLDVPLAPHSDSYQPIRTARGKRYYCCTTRNSRTAGVMVEA